MRRRHTVRPHDVDVAVGLMTLVGARRLARADNRLEQGLEILHVRRPTLVDDDEVDGQLLHPPVLVRAEELAHDADVLGLVDLHEHDREVAGDPVRPQRVGTTHLTREHTRRWPQRPVRVHHAAGEALEEVRLVGTDTEVMLLNLCLRPGQRRGALERRRIAIFFGEVQGLVARWRDERREGDACGLAGRKPHAAPQTDDRIEHRTGRVGQASAVNHHRRCPDAAPTIEEPGAIGLPRQIPDRLAVDDDDVGQPGRRVAP